MLPGIGHRHQGEIPVQSGMLHTMYQATAYNVTQFHTHYITNQILVTGMPQLKYRCHIYENATNTIFSREFGNRPIWCLSLLDECERNSFASGRIHLSRRPTDDISISGHCNNTRTSGITAVQEPRGTKGHLAVRLCSGTSSQNPGGHF